jgi:small neutral amino acid transporter SnatA (MarC family)
MGKLLLTAIALLVLVIVAGGAFLMFWNIPAPSARVERVIPDARFPR